MRVTPHGTPHITPHGTPHETPHATPHTTPRGTPYSTAEKALLAAAQNNNAAANLPSSTGVSRGQGSSYYSQGQGYTTYSTSGSGSGSGGSVAGVSVANVNPTITSSTVSNLNAPSNPTGTKPPLNSSPTPVVVSLALIPFSGLPGQCPYSSFGMGSATGFLDPTIQSAAASTNAHGSSSISTLGTAAHLCSHTNNASSLPTPSIPANATAFCNFNGNGTLTSNTPLGFYAPSGVPSQLTQYQAQYQYQLPYSLAGYSGSNSNASHFMTAQMPIPPPLPLLPPGSVLPSRFFPFPVPGVPGNPASAIHTSGVSLCSPDEDPLWNCPLPAYSSLSPVKVAFLMKQGHTFKSWRKRLVALEGRYLFYYVDEEDTAPRGVICLDGCIVQEEIAIGKERKTNAFSLFARQSWNVLGRKKHEDRTYIFTLSSFVETGAWMALLDSCSTDLPRYAADPLFD